MFFYKRLFLWLLFSPLYFISKYTKRDPQIWAFGGFADRYSDNVKYLYDYMSESEPLYKCVWITGNKDIFDDLNSQGKFVKYRYSFSGLYYSLISGVYVYGSYCSDINFWTSRGGVKLNLWHGTPMKVIEKSICIGPLRYIFNPENVFEIIKGYILYPSLKSAPDIVLSSSEYEKNCFLEAFENPIVIKSKSLRYINSRNKQLTKNNETLKVLYAPTWRSVGVRENEVFVELFLSEVNQLLENKTIAMEFIISIHPNSKFENIDFSKLPKISKYSGIDISTDIPSFDVLITDYSSILFDFLSFNKDVFILSNDYEFYSQQDRGFYPECQAMLCHSLIEDIPKMIEVIQDVTFLKGNKNKIDSNFNYFNDVCEDYGTFLDKIKVAIDDKS